MIVDVRMNKPGPEDQHQLNIEAWWAKTPEFTLATLRRQLELARALWPELADCRLLGEVKAKPAPRQSADVTA